MLLFILFVLSAVLAGLKIAGVLLISWWLVFAPAILAVVLFLATAYVLLRLASQMGNF